MLWRVIIVLLAVAAPVGAQQATPRAKVAEQGASKSRAAPWLVTVVHTLSVKDVIDQLRARGFVVSPLNRAVSPSRAITNVTSGLVIGPSGRILVRLANFKDKLGVPIRPKPEAITVITGDGRRLRPSVVAYDPTTGYSVLEVPDLAVKPPTFAPAFVPSQQGERVRLLFQVPDHVTAPAKSETQAQRANASEKPFGPIPVRRADVPPALRIVEDDVRITPRSGVARARPGDVNVVGLEVNQSAALGESVVLNKKGQVIGLMERLGPALGVVKSIDQLRAMAERLLLQNERRRGWLGIRVEQLSNAVVKRQFSPHAAGKARLRVKEVFPDSPAARAGVRPGDFIRRVNGQLVKTLGQLAAITLP
ncbi:MAG: PDZ domain-containing protein, partial [Acidobacteria bacterium]